MINKIYTKGDESWMEVLWKWADDNCEYAEALPRDRDGLVNLTLLNLSFNQLTEVPKEIFKLVNLTELYINDNKLTKVPKELQGWFEMGDTSYTYL